MTPRNESILRKYLHGAGTYHKKSLLQTLYRRLLPRGGPLRHSRVELYTAQWGSCGGVEGQRNGAGYNRVHDET